VNSRQKMVLGLGFAVMVVMLLVPPWTLAYEGGNKSFYRNLGYSAVWAPPEALEGAQQRGGVVRMNVARLIFQAILVAIAVGTAMVFVAGKKDEPPSQKGVRPLQQRVKAPKSYQQLSS